MEEVEVKETVEGEAAATEVEVKEADNADKLSAFITLALRGEVLLRKGGLEMSGGGPLWIRVVSRLPRLCLLVSKAKLTQVYM